jgi:charged multivesicular body protein 3
MANGILDWIPFLRKDPKEVVQKWRRELRKEKNHINRDIRNLMMEQKKVERSIKEAAQRNDLVSAKVCCVRIFGVYGCIVNI